jgi:hypothetical protein
MVESQLFSIANPWALNQNRTNMRYPEIGRADKILLIEPDNQLNYEHKTHFSFFV